VNGVAHQKYFNSEKEADYYYDKIVSEKTEGINYRKRSSAKTQHLPVGIFLVTNNTKTSHGITKPYTFFKTVIFINGKEKAKTKKFRDDERDQQTIKDLLAWREEMIALKNKLEMAE
jgi:hypothetical protein